MSQITTKIYLYGRTTTGTTEEIEALEAPEGLTLWIEKESVTNEGIVNSSELFFSVKELTAEEITEKGVIYLGTSSASHFYMAEKINGQYVTYVTSNPSGPGMVLFPASEAARMYILKNPDDGQYYPLSFAGVKSIVPNPNSYLCTRELALEYGISLNNPHQDSQESELVETIFAQLALKVNASNVLPVDNVGVKPDL